MATTDGTALTIPVGRKVWGHAAKQRQRTDNNNKPIVKADGTPAMQYVFGYAIPKEAYLRQIYAGQPNLEQIVAEQAFERIVWPAMSGEAAKGYPSGVPSNFAWKYDDGDDTRPVNGGGVPYAQREGYPGHYVLTVASQLENPPPIFKFDPSTGGYVQLPAEATKTGDYFALSVRFVCNIPDQRTHTPSLYVNPEGLEFIGYGAEIKSAAAINPMQAFGGRQHMLPPGASATPMSSAPAGVGMPQPGQPAPMGAPMQQPPAMMPQTTGYPAPQPMQQQPAPQYQPQPMQPQPGGYPPPATDFIPAAHQPPAMMPQGGAPMGQPMQQQPAPQYQPQPMQPQPGAPYGQMPGQMPPR